jgi:RNA polymerase sigma factor (sigma-70 family)
MFMPVSTLGSRLRHMVQQATAERWATLSDAALLEEFRRHHDPAALEAVVCRHGPLVLAVLGGQLASAADVEDAFQATFLVLLRKAGTIRRAESLGSWLHGVARRVAATARVAAQRRQQREQAVAEPEAYRPTADPCWQETVAVLHQEVAALPAHYRNALALTYFEDKSRTEAAATLGCSAAAVKGILERARHLLRTRLQRRGVTLSAGLLVTALATSAAPGIPQRWLRLALAAPITPRPTAVSLAQEVLMATPLRTMGHILLVVSGFGLLMGVLAFTQPTPTAPLPSGISFSEPAPQVPPTPAELAKTVAQRQEATLTQLVPYYAEIKLAEASGQGFARSAKYWRAGDRIRIVEQFAEKVIHDVEMKEGKLKVITTDPDRNHLPDVTSVLITPISQRVVDTDPWECSLFTLPVGLLGNQPRPTYTLAEALKAGELQAAHQVTESGRPLIYLQISLPKEQRRYEVWVDPARHGLTTKARHLMLHADGTEEWKIDFEVQEWKEIKPGFAVPARTLQRSLFKGKAVGDRTATMTALQVQGKLPAIPPMPVPPAGTLVLDQIQSIVYPLDDKGNPTGPVRQVIGTHVPRVTDGPGK